MKIVRVVLTFLLLATFAGMAAADDWPTRRLRIVVPFPAGGSGDVQVRIVADELAKVLGQPVMVENKPGASGGLAAVDVAHAPPDGHTLMVGSVGTHAINVSLYSKLQYDPVKDIAQLTLMTVFPQLIVPGINFNGNSLANLIASLKADARKASYGSSGIGSPTHLAGELFKTETGADIVHVPYRGQGPAATDLLAGELQVMFPSVPDTLAFIVSGKLRALAIMSDRRLKLLPHVPTTVELGWPKLISSFWAGLYTTAGTPQSVLERLNRELMQIVRSPGFAGRVEPLGFEARATTRDEFVQFNADEIKRWGQIVRGLGIQLNQ
jgi:tripartite-type tricarboxylate transporter receptor subunit TctC